MAGEWGERGQSLQQEGRVYGGTAANRQGDTRLEICENYLLIVCIFSMK